MSVAQPDQLEQSVHDGPFEGRFDFFERVVMTVDCSTLAGLFHCLMVVGPGEQPDVVDLGDASGEELDRPCREVPVVVFVEC